MQEGISMKKQAVNPFLPVNEYIPDGEPHVFGDRVYLIGSHDAERGDTFCMLPYQFYSAPVDDLSNWTSHGVSYDAQQDPLSRGGQSYLYAPDVVQGNDGRYYLYYCLSGAKGRGGYANPVSVAVCDTPDGKYKFLGHVRNPDGTFYRRFVPFDPAVINDNGVIRLYYGTLYPFENLRNALTGRLADSIMMKIFNRTREELHAEPGGIMGPVTVTLADDMLTVNSEPKRIAPPVSKGTLWEKHPFFEGSSIRKIGDTYYFIYSSWLNHELCYATSHSPDRDFIFRGTIVSNGDIGYQGRKAKDRLNATGTTHGSIECINGQWYVFYHRVTHGSDYSRQACAEPITIEPDGTIPQVEISSCGLNNAPLMAEGSYPAVICCNLTNGKMPHGSNKKVGKPIPCVFSDEKDQFIHLVTGGTWIGYKYFSFKGPKRLHVTLRGEAEGSLIVSDRLGGATLAVIPVSASKNWHSVCQNVPFGYGKSALFLCYQGTGALDVLNFSFN